MSSGDAVRGGWVRQVLKVFSRAAILWQSHNAPRLGAALAFYTVLSLAPLLVVAVGVASLFLSQAAVQEGVIEQVGQLVGTSGQEVARTLFQNASDAYLARSGVIASVVGGGALLFGASVVLLELRAALNILWEVPGASTAREGVLTLVKNRLIALGMVLGIGFLLLVSLFTSALISAVSTFLGSQLGVPVSLAVLFEATLSVVVVATFFSLLYKYLPAVRIKWRDTWLGAAITAVLFTVGKWLIGLYLGNSAISSAYGTAGSLVVFLLWVYFSAQIFFFGAALCRAVRDSRRGQTVIVQGTR